MCWCSRPHLSCNVTVQPKAMFVILFTVPVFLFPLLQEIPLKFSMMITAWHTDRWEKLKVLILNIIKVCDSHITRNLRIIHTGMHTHACTYTHTAYWKMTSCQIFQPSATSGFLKFTAHVCSYIISDINSYCSCLKVYILLDTTHDAEAFYNTKETTQFRV